MARVAYEYAKQSVIAALNASGGTLSMDELRAALPAEERREILSRLFDMVHHGDVKSILRAQEGAKPVHEISVGGE